MSRYQRIACLSTEAVETLCALGAEDCIAGISGFTTRPPRARTEKPKINGFSSSRLEREGIKSANILSPGPSAIMHGLPQLCVLIARWQEQRG